VNPTQQPSRAQFLFFPLAAQPGLLPFPFPQPKTSIQPKPFIPAQPNPFPTQAQLSPPLLAQRTPRPSRCSARTERSPAPHALGSPADIPGPHVSTIPSPFLSLASATPRRVHRRNRRRFPFPNRARDPRILPFKLTRVLSPPQYTFFSPQPPPKT